MSFSGHIAIEGPIGVGKTTLAKIIAERLDGKPVLEMAEENPFLPDFYKDRKTYAFQTQIFFLMSRYSQQEKLYNQDLFLKCTVSDYFFAKDKIFARLNLSEHELVLYNQICKALEKNIRYPDLVIYLTGEIDTLLYRIKKRDRDFEKNFDKDYLTKLCEAYSNYFFYYNESPLLVVNSDNIDIPNNSEKIDYIIDKIISCPQNTEYINFDNII